MCACEAAVKHVCVCTYMQSITGYDKLNVLKFSGAYKKTETISLVHVVLYVSEIHSSFGNTLQCSTAAVFLSLKY